MRKAPEIKLSKVERRELEKWTRATTMSVRKALRARVLLLAGQGTDDTVIAGRLGISRQRSGRIRGRYLKGGLKALEGDFPRSGRPRRIDAQKIVALTTGASPEAVGERALPAVAAKDTLVIGISQFPQNFNPNIESMLAKSYMLAMARLQITIYDANWKLICLLCTELPSY